MVRLYQIIIAGFFIFGTGILSAGQNTAIVDWRRMELKVSAVSTILEEESGNTADWQYTAQRRAEESLFENFIRSMKKVQVDAYSTAADVIHSDYTKNRRLYSYYTGMRKSEIRYIEQDVIIEKIFPLFGEDGFMQILFEAGYDTGNFHTYDRFVHSIVFTGLVVDARGLGKVPAAAPRIFDSNHTLVFSADMMYLESFRKWGAVQYTDDLNVRLYEKRVGDNPYRIVAIHDDKLIETDIAISVEDAQVLLQKEGSRENLMQGRVVIIMDSLRV